MYLQAQGGVDGMGSGGPAIQYVRLADGYLKAVMAVTSNDQPQPVSMLDQHPQPSSASQTLGNTQSSMIVNQNYPLRQRQPIQYTEAPPVLVTGPATMPSNIPNHISNGVQPQASPADHHVGTAQLHYPVKQPNTIPNPPEMAVVRSGGFPALPGDHHPSTDGPGDLPANASQTLYVDDVPLDMQKRELCHIFRPFGGFKV